MNKRYYSKTKHFSHWNHYNFFKWTTDQRYQIYAKIWRKWQTFRDCFWDSSSEVNEWYNFVLQQSKKNHTSILNKLTPKYTVLTGFLDDLHQQKPSHLWSIYRFCKKLFANESVFKSLEICGYLWFVRFNSHSPSSPGVSSILGWSLFKTPWTSTWS